MKSEASEGFSGVGKQRSHGSWDFKGRERLRRCGVSSRTPWGRQLHLPWWRECGDWYRNEIVLDRREKGLKMINREENRARIGAHTRTEKGKQIKSLWKRTCWTCLIQQEYMQYGLLRQKIVGEVTYFIWRGKVLLMTRRTCDLFQSQQCTSGPGSSLAVCLLPVRSSLLTPWWLRVERLWSGHDLLMYVWTVASQRGPNCEWGLCFLP